MMDMLEVGTYVYLQFDQLGQLKMLIASWLGDNRQLPWMLIVLSVKKYIESKI